MEVAEPLAGRAVLPGRVPSLQDYEQRVFRLRIERGLQLVHTVGQLAEPGIELGLGCVLAPARVLIPQGNPASRGDWCECHDLRPQASGSLRSSATGRMPKARSRGNNPSCATSSVSAL